MSFDAQMTAIYRLFYKQHARDAFFANRTPPVEDLTADEMAALVAIPKQRLSRIVELHRGDIARGWYESRYPATWLALQHVLSSDADAVVAQLTESDAFERRVNDDADGRALAAFVDELMLNDRLSEAMWIPELLMYEQILAGHWDAIKKWSWRSGSVAALGFSWDVQRIRSSLVDDSTFPIQEEAYDLCLLFSRDDEGVSEAEISRPMLSLMGGIVGHENCRDVSNQADEDMVAEATDLLLEIGWEPPEPNTHP